MFEHGSSLRIIGHRGAAGVAPENTVPAIEHGLRGGAQAIEFDLRRSADGQLIVLHDASVDRTTNGTGLAENLPLADIRKLDAGYRFTPDRGDSYPYRDCGVQIPTLDEALEAAAGLPVIIEVKSRPAGIGLAAWFRGHAARSRMLDRILVGGYSAAHLAPVAEVARYRCATEKDLKSFVLLGKLGLRPGLPAEVDAAMVPVRSRGLRVVTPRFVRRTQALGKGVFVWTVNRTEEMRRLLDMGVDGLITDFPAIGRRVVDERAAEGA